MKILSKFSSAITLLTLGCFILRTVECTNTRQNAGENPILLEGDIVPTRNTIAAEYGTKFNRKLVDEVLAAMSSDPSLMSAEDRDSDDDNIISVNGSVTNGSILLWKTDWRSDELWHIPVYFQSGAYTEPQLKLVKQGIRRLQKMTASIKFDFITAPYTNGTPFLHVGTFGLDICASYVGMDTSVATLPDGQFVWLGNSCLERGQGQVQHEIMHALGFHHEHSRPDRDTYVTVLYQNVAESEKHNFDIRNDVDSLGTAYDYKSVMHYSEYELSNVGGQTIDAKGNAVGQREKLSFLDKVSIRLLYQCESGPRTIQQYNAEGRCTADCKCGLNKNGCRKQMVNYDGLCKGTLVCKNNICKDA